MSPFNADDLNEIQKDIYKCLHVYGVEGTEDKLKEIYAKMPELKERFLSEYYNIVRRKK
jgi:hypothetical protein